MNTSFIDSRRNTTLTQNFYPALVTIQEQTEVINAYGAVTYTWSDLANHIDLACNVALTAGDEIKESDNEYGSTTHMIAMNGTYPDINRLHRAVIDSDIYDIQYVSPPSHDNSVTYLLCHITETGA